MVGWGGVDGGRDTENINDDIDRQIDVDIAMHIKNRSSLSHIIMVSTFVWQ